MPFCSECGTGVPDDAKFCPDCGHELAARAAASGAESGPDSEWGVDSRRDDPYDDVGSASGGSSTGWDDGGGSAFDDRSSGGVTADVGPDPRRAEGVSSTAPTTDVDGPAPFASSAVSFAAGFAVKDDHDALLIGSLIEFAGFFVPFVNLIVRGYGLRLGRAAARGQTHPPEFDDYGDMFVDGLKFLAHGLAYGFAWLFGGGLLTAIAFVAHETVGALVLLGVGLVGAYFWAASLTAYMATDDFGAAFSPDYALAFATSGTYVKAFFLAAALAVGYAVLLFVSIFTIIGVVIVSVWGAYFYLTFWGYYYREAVAAGDVPPAPDVSV